MFLCIRVRTYFCYLFGTSSRVNTDLVGTSRPHGDQSSVLMRQHVISDLFLVKIRVSVWAVHNQWKSMQRPNKDSCANLCVCVCMLICEAHFSWVYNTVKSCTFSARDYMFNSGLQCSEHGAVFALHFAVFQWSDILQPWYQRQSTKKNLFGLNMEGLYFHLARIGVQTIIHTMPNEIQRIVFIDDP